MIWESQQSHAYLYAGAFGFFAYVQMSPSSRKGEHVQGFRWYAKLRAEHVQKFCWYTKLRAGGVKCTGMLEPIRTSAK